MKTILGKPYQDLGGADGIPEDKRIMLIADQARRFCRTIAVFLDDDQVIVNRYRQKLILAGCRIEAQVTGPVPGVVTLKIVAKPN